MDILIYGGGAVGLGIAAALIKSGENVDIVARGETYKFLKEDGIHLKGIFGEYDASSDKYQVLNKTEECGAKKYDFILVAVKSNDSDIAAEDIKKNIFDAFKSKIVLLQNGWGNYEVFTKYFNGDNVYNGRVITGFRKPKPNISEITVHADDIHIGKLSGGMDEDVRKLAKSIADGGIPCIETENIGKDLWAKMLYNCSLNPVGAVFDIPYGELSKSTYSMEIMKSIIEEIFEVMNYYEYSTYWENGKEYFETLINKLIPPTAAHKSSTLQDINAGKKTEIDALNGQIVLLGEKAGVNVKTNKTIVNMIKFLESKKVLK